MNCVFGNFQKLAFFMLIFCEIFLFDVFVGAVFVGLSLCFLIYFGTWMLFSIFGIFLFS